MENDPSSSAKMHSQQPLPSDEMLNERFRPQLRFSPLRNFMNDPNGLVFHDGTYHVFYQHNPVDNEWGHMSWGHATSQDLVHWVHQRVALNEFRDAMIFSGSAVHDKHNTSGLGDADDGPLVAIYTRHMRETKFESQCLAYSNDGGESWTHYEGNPVLDRNGGEFRDPKVFWHAASNAWVMVVVLADQRSAAIYRSANLIDWDHASTFGPAGKQEVTNWECPDLFELPVEGTDETRWVLQVGVGDGSVAGGSGCQYFTGRFDGTSFEMDGDPESPSRWVDFGPDFYAAQSFDGVPDGRRIWTAWMSNWHYANETPTSPWRGALCFPREVRLVKTVKADAGYRLRQSPVREIGKLRFGRQVSELVSLDLKPRPLTRIPIAGAFEAKIETIGLDSDLKLDFESDDHSSATFQYHPGGSVSLMRHVSGNAFEHDKFPGFYKAELGERLEKIHLIVDRNGIELFLNDGVCVVHRSNIRESSRAQSNAFE